MADEPHVIRAIDWRQVLPWTNLFRAFRIAIHPSKLLLGIILLALLYGGGRFLDWVWPASSSAIPNEIRLWQEASRSDNPGKTFDNTRREARRALERQYAELLYGWEGAPVKNRDDALKDAKSGKHLSAVKAHILSERDKRVEEINKAWKEFGAKKTGEERQSAERMRDASIASIYQTADESWATARSIKGEGIFLTFFEYQTTQLNAIVSGVTGGSWLESGGVVDSVTNFVKTGPSWLLGAHLWYFVIWGIWFLIIWSIFGGAIARIAALHVARDEKLSMRQALKFSGAKVLSFIFAPVIPLLIVLVIGLLITVVSLLGNIPWIGPILIGVPFILALAAGFVMTLVLIGTIGGFTLMYPTIAVEGSDSFDAISRSFSYIYARPWRMLFYTAIAVAYGALCYLFVRIFIYLILAMTHSFAGLGVFADAAPGVPIWTTLWPAPIFGNLPYDAGFLSLNSGGDIGAWFIALWVGLLLAAMGAFVVSFFFSANTIIYYLMRREVDATDMEDVYQDEADDEFSDSPLPAAPAPSNGGTPGTPAAPAEQAPAPQESAAPEQPAPTDPPSSEGQSSSAPTDQPPG